MIRDTKFNFVLFYIFTEHSLARCCASIEFCNSAKLNPANNPIYGLLLDWLLIELTSFRLAYLEGPVELLVIPPLFSFLTITGLRSCCTAKRDNKKKTKPSVKYGIFGKPSNESENIYNHFSFHKPGTFANDNTGIDSDGVSSLRNSSGHDIGIPVVSGSSVWRNLYNPHRKLLHNAFRRRDRHTRDRVQCCSFAVFDRSLMIFHPFFYLLTCFECRREVNVFCNV